MQKLVRNLFIIIGCFLILSHCQKKKTTLKTGTNPDNNPTTYIPPSNNPTPTPPPPTSQSFTPCVADGNQTIDCYLIRDIVVHGAPEGTVFWSSLTDLPNGISQNIFSTNARFNVEIYPRRRYFGTDSKGRTCAFQPRPYEKLQVGIRVRARESQTGDYHVFDNVPVDYASFVHEFSPGANSAFPQVVEILSVKWDWSCTDYANQGFPDVPGYCPWDNVWSTECVSLDLRFSTDTTKDLPGPRQ